MLDYFTLAFQLFGGVLGALLAGVLAGNLSLGALGNAVTGIVGGPVGGLVLTNYLALAPATLPDGALAEPAALLVQFISGAAGGAILAVLVGLLKSIVRN